jgi:hypothetical protein
MNIVPAFVIHTDDAKTQGAPLAKGELAAPSAGRPDAASSPTPEFRDFLPSGPEPESLDPHQPTDPAAPASSSKAQPPVDGKTQPFPAWRAIESAIAAPSPTPFAAVLPREGRQPLPIDIRTAAAPAAPRARRGGSPAEPFVAPDVVAVKAETPAMIGAPAAIGTRQDAAVPTLAGSIAAPRDDGANASPRRDSFTPTAPTTTRTDSPTDPTAPSIPATESADVAPLGDPASPSAAVDAASPPRLAAASTMGTSASPPTPARAKGAPSPPEALPTPVGSTEPRASGGASPGTGQAQKPSALAPAAVAKEPQEAATPAAAAPAPPQEAARARNQGLERDAPRFDPVAPTREDLARIVGKSAIRGRVNVATEASAISPTLDMNTSRAVAAPTHVASSNLAPGDNAMTPVIRMSVDDVSARAAHDDPASAAVLSAANQIVMRRAAHGEMDHPELGRVDVSAHLRDGQLDVRIVTQRAESAATLLPHARAIAADLHTADAPAARVDIQSRSGAATSHDSGASRHSGASGNGSQSSSDERRALPVDAGEAPVSPAPRRVRIVL